MNDDIAISVEHVSKKYCKSLKRSMFYGIQDIGRNLFGQSSHSDQLRKDEFWALDDVSFEVKKGETLGIIGANGAGKTTLLKMLNGIFWPDKGKISIRGRVGALIQVGAGFHPLLTGRENIYVNAAILGMSKAEVDAQFDAIVEFADIGDFLDAPVKHYSSGMFVRLGFAVAVHCSPEILLVDEVLAVGDVNFQKKCFERIYRLQGNGLSTIFVSHSIFDLERLCSRAVLLHHGKQLYCTTIRACVKEYINILHQQNNDKIQKSVANNSFGLGNVTISNVVVFEDGRDKNKPEIEFSKDFVIQFDYAFQQKDNNNHQFRIVLSTFEGREVQRFFVQESRFNDNFRYVNEKIIDFHDKGRMSIRVLQPKLVPQVYKLTIGVVTLHIPLSEGGLNDVCSFRIIEPKAPAMYFEYQYMHVTEFDYDVHVEL